MQRIDVKRAMSYVHVGGNVIEGKGKKPYRRNVTKKAASAATSRLRKTISRLLMPSRSFRATFWGAWALIARW